MSTTKTKNPASTIDFTRILCLVPVLFLLSCAGERPNNIGVVLGKLTPCPATPNCVSSNSTHDQKKIAPLTASISEIKLLLQDMDNVNIVTAENDYLYAEFKTTLGFVDDVEFYTAPQSQVTQIRSASRIGKNDLGANRDRIENIRQQLKQ